MHRRSRPLCSVRLTSPVPVAELGVVRRRYPSSKFMTTTIRSVVGAILGLLIFLRGFWLHFHVTDFMTSGGYAPFVHVFQEVATCLMYAGAALAVSAIVVWMLSGSRNPSPAQKNDRHA